MSLKVVLGSFSSVTVTDGTVATLTLPVGGYNTGRINVISEDAGDAGLVGLFTVDGTTPTNGIGGGEPLTDNTTLMCSTKTECQNFQFIRYSGYTGTVYITFQGYIDTDTPVAAQ